MSSNLIDGISMDVTIRYMEYLDGPWKKRDSWLVTGDITPDIPIK
jgi:hypothetical protein